MSDNHVVAKEVDIHDSVIESIAIQYQRDEQEIRTIYETELSKLKVGSRIKSFLPVLCTRHVKEILMHSARVPQV